MAATLVLGTSPSGWGFDSLYGHQSFADVVKWQTHRSQKAARKHKGSTPFIGTTDRGQDGNAAVC